MPMNPTSDMVGVAWLAGITGLSGAVATTLPQDPATWITVLSAQGFVTVSTIGGSPDLYLPLRKPVMQIDCWATNLSTSGRPPWGAANHLAELIRAHIEAGPRASNFARLLTFTTLGDYGGATVYEAIMRTEPRRGITQGIVPTGDPGSYARYLFDLELQWKLAS